LQQENATNSENIQKIAKWKIEQEAKINKATAAISAQVPQAVAVTNNNNANNNNSNVMTVNY
jgi:hypothetical protein